MSLSLPPIALVAALVLSPSLARAQAPEPPRFFAELRFGGLWPQPRAVDEGVADVSDHRPSAGGRFGWYFGGVERRASLVLHADWAPLGSVEFFDDTVGSFAKLEGHWFAVAPTFTVDVVRTPRAVIDVHAGPAVVGEVTTYLLERTFDDPDDYGDDYENVCDLRAFEGLCLERYRASAVIGFSARAIVYEPWKLHVGLGYSWLTYGRHLLAGSVGASW